MKSLLLAVLLIPTILAAQTNIFAECSYTEGTTHRSVKLSLDLETGVFYMNSMGKTSIVEGGQSGLSTYFKKDNLAYIIRPNAQTFNMDFIKVQFLEGADFTVLGAGTCKTGE